MRAHRLCKALLLFSHQTLRFRSRTPIVAVAGLLLAASLPAHAATFVVDDVADAVDASPGDGTCATGLGTCTLRAAVQEANALTGADRIECKDKLMGVLTFALPGRGEDQAATGDLDITDDVVIALDCRPLDASVVAPFQIDAAGLDRAFHILSGVAVTLSGVSITGGQTRPGENGGAILNEGSLTVLSDFTRALASTAGGDGGGLYNAGTASLQNAAFVNDSAPAGRGGGIFNAGTLTIQGIDLNHDSALAGGGLFNAATATLRAAEITSNHATSGAGGGIVNDGGAVLHLGNLTVANNDATLGGAGVDNAGTADLHSVTIIGHATAGLRNDDGSGGATAIKNTILADACGGTITSAGYNVTASCALAGDPTGNHIDVDPGLSAGVDCNTVSYCPYYRPLPGSVAIDAGDPAGCKDYAGAPFGLDQRGVIRQTGAACDAGSVESARACEGGLPFATAKLEIGGLGNGAGQQTLRFQGAAPLTPSFELLPNIRGAQLTASDLGLPATWVNRSQEVDDPISGGGAVNVSCHAWRHSKTTFNYREAGSKGCSATPDEDGLVKSLQLRDDRQAAAGDVKIKYRITRLKIPDPAFPIETSFTFGASAFVSSAGYCGTYSFAGNECVRKGKKLVCEKH